MVGARVLLGPLASRPKRPGILDARRWMWTAVALLGSFTLKVCVLQPMGLNFFGIVYFAYVDLVVVLPLLGLAALAVARRGRKTPRGSQNPGEEVTDHPLGREQPRGRGLTGTGRTLAFAMVTLAGVGVYATFIEPFRLQLEEATMLLAPARAGKEPLRIGVLADIQTRRITAHERNAVDTLMAQRPDVILLPGDLFQGTAEELRREHDALRELLGRLSAPGGVFFVIGNTDRASHDVRRLLEGTPVTLLDNELHQVQIRDREVTIGAVNPWGNPTRATTRIRELEDLPGTADIRILLSHFPDSALELRHGTRVDLTIAGHTHGGQIVVPFFGPPVTLTQVPRNVAAGGLHDLDGRRIYVSRGVGVERDQAPRIRFLCPPEVTLLTLR